MNVDALVLPKRYRHASPEKMPVGLRTAAATQLTIITITPAWRRALDDVRISSVGPTMMATAMTSVMNEMRIVWDQLSDCAYAGT